MRWKLYFSMIFEWGLNLVRLTKGVIFRGVMQLIKQIDLFSKCHAICVCSQQSRFLKCVIASSRHDVSSVIYTSPLNGQCSFSERSSQINSILCLAISSTVMLNDALIPTNLQNDSKIRRITRWLNRLDTYIGLHTCIFQRLHYSNRKNRPFLR